MAVYEIKFESLRVRVDAPSEQEAVALAKEMAFPMTRRGMFGMSAVPEAEEIREIEKNEPTGMGSEAE